MGMISNHELADELIRRLNALCENPEVRKDVGALIEEQTFCSEVTLNHPTIQANAPKDGLCECGAYGGRCSLCSPSFGFLGVLNGLVGTIGSGPRAAWGLITAEFDDDGGLMHFQRTKP
jgi:hypothetical protein